MINIEKFTQILNDFKEKHVLVIGDLMLDEFHWCSVSRISPEAPVPICKVEKTTLVPGGAGNVALNLKTLGANIHLCSLMGKDSSGEKLAKLLAHEDINTDGILMDPNKPTILKSRIIANQQHVTRVDREEVNEITQEQQDQCLGFIKSHLDRYDAILISDYLKGFLPPSFLKNLIQLAREANIPVIVDPKGKDYTKYTGASIITPNFSEFQTAVKDDVFTESDIDKKGKNLLNELRLDALIVTRSEKGLSIITDNNKVDIPTKAREVFDITGAGDTFIATLSASISTGATLEEAATLANFAAGVVVGKIGTSTVSADEIQKVIERETR